MADADARHVLQEDGLSARRISRMLELAPVEVRHRAADEVQHGIRLIECRVEVEFDHAEIGDVARRSIGVDVENVVRRCPVAARDCARDGSGGVRRAIAEVDGVARRSARRREAAVDVTADGATVEVQRMARRRARAGSLATVDIACNRAARQRDLAACGVSCARRDIAAVDGTCNSAARDLDFVVCERAASRRMGAIKRAAQAAVRNFGLVLSRGSHSRC